jgi:hypothetical protein
MGQAVAGMVKTTIDRGRVAQQAEASAPDPGRRIGEQLFEAGLDAIHRR